MRIGFAEATPESYRAAQKLLEIGHSVDISNTNDMLLGQHSRQSFDLLIAELMLSEGMTALELFGKVGRTPIIVVGHSRNSAREVRDRGGIFVNMGNDEALLDAVQKVAGDRRPK